VQDLPKLFRGATTVTRSLKIDYVWNDSLCIIQDSDEDWNFEAARMGDIYQRSFLTILALDARDSHEGILSMRPGQATNDDGSNSLPQRQEYFRRSPLCKGAWALQERLLSTRILYYTNCEILWECLSCTAREGSHRITALRTDPYSRERHECSDLKNASS
jgi:hypothetical protein